MKIAVTIAPLSQARLEFCNFCSRVGGDGPRREENFLEEETGMHAAKRVEERRCAFHRTLIKPVWQQMNEYWLLIDKITPESITLRAVRNDISNLRRNMYAKVARVTWLTAEEFMWWKLDLMNIQVNHFSLRPCLHGVGDPGLVG